MEQARFNASVSVADVLGRKRQKNMLAVTVSVVSAKHVEQHEEGRLAAVGQGDILRFQAPAIFAVEQLGERGDKLLFPLRRIVDADQTANIALVTTHIRENFLYSLLDLGNMPGISPAHHDHVVAGCHGVTQVIHEGRDTGIGGELATKSREFHGIKSI